MYAASRKAELCQELLRNRSFSVKDMAIKLNVTEETIRRDIKVLVDEGIATKTHGGAILKNSVMNTFSKTEHKKLLVENKRAMAQLAIQYITNKMCIYIDASTTAFEILPFLADYQLTVVTGSLDVIAYCANKENIKLICLGGEYNPKSGEFYGSQAMDSISFMNFDLCVLSCRTASLQSGLCEADRCTAEMKRLVSEHSLTTLAIIDHTKLNKSSFIKTIDVADVDVLISDLPLTREWTEYLEKHNVDYRVATKELPEYLFLTDSGKK